MLGADQGEHFVLGMLPGEIVGEEFPAGAAEEKASPAHGARQHVVENMGGDACEAKQRDGQNTIHQENGSRNSRNRIVNVSTVTKISIPVTLALMIG